VVKVLNSYHVYTKHYEISNLEIMVKIWWAISPFLSDRVRLKSRPILPFNVLHLGLWQSCLFKHDAKSALFLSSEMPLEHCIFPVHLAMFRKFWMWSLFSFVKSPTRISIGTASLLVLYQWFAQMCEVQHNNTCRWCNDAYFCKFVLQQTKKSYNRICICLPSGQMK